MDAEIRRISSPAELSACASLMASSSPWNKLYFSREQCEAKLLDPLVRVDGIVSEEGVLAFVASIARGVDGDPMMAYLCVAENLRGQGIGGRLIRFFEDILFPSADNLYLFVSDINPAARRLYVRNGYLQVGALPDFNLVMQTEFLHRKSRRPRQSGRADGANDG